MTDLTADKPEYKGEKKRGVRVEFTIIEGGPYSNPKLWKRGSRVSAAILNNKAPLM